MSPKSLTDTQKQAQKRGILEKGKSAVLQYGFKKVSVDDIAKSAGIAKGTFYLYFQSKEDFLAELVSGISESYFALVEEIILNGGGANLKDNIRKFFYTVFDLPEILFFFKEHKGIEEFVKRLYDTGFDGRETAGYLRALSLAGIDTEKVMPSVVHNYIHAIYLTKVADMMIEEYRPATVELLTEGLINYIFSGLKEVR